MNFLWKQTCVQMIMLDMGVEKHFCGGEFMQKFKKGAAERTFSGFFCEFQGFFIFPGLIRFFKSPLSLS